MVIKEWIQIGKLRYLQKFQLWATETLGVERNRPSVTNLVLLITKLPKHLLGAKFYWSS